MYKTVTSALSRLLKTPPYIILFVSDRCWMKCRHCWYNEAWKGKNLTGTHLTFDELSRIADSIQRIQFLSLCGGEAFLREDIEDIADMFARKTILKRYQIPTAGFDPDLIVSKTERLLRMNKNIPFRVDVSLDGTEKTHEFIRNIKGGYERARTTISRLNDLKARFSYFDVGVMTTVMNQNQDEIEELASFVEEVHPEGEWMVKIIRGEPRDAESRAVEVDKYSQVQGIIDKRIRAGRYRGHNGHPLAPWLTAKNATRRKIIRRIVEGTYQGGGCAAGSLAGVIYNDGEVRPCEMLDLSFGNIRECDYQLPVLWNSSRADEIRAWIQDTRCTCTHECFLSTSLLIQPRHWPDILRERLKLMRGSAGNGPTSLRTGKGDENVSR